MNKLKEFLKYISENKKQVITLLIIGITVLSIPVGLQLSQKQQTLKSRATGDGGTVSGTPAGGGTATCDANNRATFNWTAASSAGKTVQNYVLRINKSPADWAPDFTGTDFTTVSPGDRAVSAGNRTSAVVSLSAGSYLDFTIQAVFTDGTKLDSGHFGAFNCPGTVTPPPPTGCSCVSDNCLPGCNFTKLTGVTYSNPTQCKLASNIPTTVPTTENKNAWCSRPKRTLGDADGNNTIDVLDYAYYLRAALGAKTPAEVNPDFSGDGEVGQADLTIWKDGRGK